MHDVCAGSSLLSVLLSSSSTWPAISSRVRGQDPLFCEVNWVEARGGTNASLQRSTCFLGHLSSWLKFDEGNHFSLTKTEQTKGGIRECARNRTFTIPVVRNEPLHLLSSTGCGESYFLLWRNACSGGGAEHRLSGNLSLFRFFEKVKKAIIVMKSLPCWDSLQRAARKLLHLQSALSNTLKKLHFRNILHSVSQSFSAAFTF